MRRRLRAFGFTLVALVGTTQVFPVLAAHAEGKLPDLEESGIGGGAISISVSADLGACASVSFNNVQVEASGILESTGVATTYNGDVAHLSGFDSQSGSNVSSLPDLCVPGNPLVNAGEVSFQATAAGVSEGGVPTMMTATTTCVYVQFGSVSCTPVITVVAPPSPSN